MRKRLKDLNVAEVACFLRDERLKGFVGMERSLLNEEIDQLQLKLRNAVAEMGCELR